jgi:hypothetical protein
LALAGTVLAAVGVSAALTAPAAQALPGQCIYTPWGGFCDSAPWQDGSFQHCESALGFSQCYQACHDPVANRAVPTDLDPRTPC